MEDSVERLLTPDEVSAVLRVPVGTLHQWRSRGIGPSGIRIGRHLRYREDELAQWIEARAQNSELHRGNVA